MAYQYLTNTVGLIIESIFWLILLSALYILDLSPKDASSSIGSVALAAWLRLKGHLISQQMACAASLGACGTLEAPPILSVPETFN